MPKNLRVLRIAPEHFHEQVRFLINFRTRTLPFFSRTYLDFFLPALPHAVAHIGLESEAQRHHRIPDAENKTKIIPVVVHITPTVWPSVYNFFSAVNFLKFLVFKTPGSGLDPDTYWIRLTLVENNSN